MPVQDEVMKSRITLIYNTVINGEPQPKELPFRIAVIGDFSDGTSKDRREKLADRQVRTVEGGNLRGLIEDMDISLNLTVLNRIDPNKEEMVNVHLPIKGIQSFSPAEVAQNIPKVKKLSELKKLLQEGLTALSNSPSLGEAFKTVYGNKEAHAALKKQLEPLSFLELSGNPVNAPIVTIENKKEKP